MTEVHVSLGVGLPKAPPDPPLLDPRGPRIVLGGADPLVGPVAPGRETMFGPRGVLWTGQALYVADTGHHRILGWSAAPERDGQPADFLLGQPGFDREGRNALGDASALTLNVPVGLARWGERGLVVCDSWNHRILVWHEAPTGSGVPADLVLGQGDFAGMDPNRGRAEAGAETMHWPSFALVHDGRLYVADTGNRRVLVWRSLPTANGAPADFVLGQPDLQSRSDNGGREAGPSGLRWPHAVAVVEGDLAVADAGDNRVLLWDGLPDETDAPAARVLGQPDFAAIDHNQSSYWPHARCLNMPYGLACGAGWLIAADTANSRLVGWRGRPETNQAAQAVAGQDHFGAKGDNRWGDAVRDSLCWPYGMQAVGRELVIADTGNHRVVFWPLAEDV